MSRNPTAKKIDAMFSHSGIWIVEDGRQREAGIFREAMVEIDRLQALVDEMEAAIDSDLAEARQEIAEARKLQREKLSEYAQLIDGTEADIKRVRNAAKSLVTQIDKTSFSAVDPT